MLHFYYGRESKDTFRYLLSLFGEGKHTIVVPDQFTHRAEMETIRVFGNTGLMNTEVVSFNRIGRKILEETGGTGRLPLNEDGRAMLLSRILREKEGDLTAFRKMSRSPGFGKKLGEMISEFKQYGTSPEALSVLSGEKETPVSLSRKLADISVVYSAYEERIRGRYLDTEDAARFYVSKAKDASFITDRTFWIYGFDPFSPMIGELFGMLLLYAKDVHLAITSDPVPGQDRDLFRLSRNFIEKEKKRAESLGVPYDEQEVPDGFLRKRTAALSHLERELYSRKPCSFSEKAEEIRFIKAESPFAEMENAAIGIRRLVREEGFRYREIAVLANDMENYGKAAERVFREYGIPVYLDEKRKILSNPAAVFVLSLLDVTDGEQAEDVFRLLKTGFTDITRKESEMLENYAFRYHIAGGKWKKPFRYGAEERSNRTLLYGEKGLEKLNEIREKVRGLLDDFEIPFAGAGTAEEKTRVLYTFLAETADLPGRIERLRDERIASGNPEEAEELRQVWDAIVSVMEQLSELMGTEPVSAGEYRDLMEEGLASKEIGIIPPALDRVIIGPARRLATGEIRALFVIGANEGILPASGEASDLLSPEERKFLLSGNQSFCKDGGWISEEENLAIYRDLAKPAEKLFISTSVSDGSKDGVRESEIYTAIRKLFPENPEETGELTPEDALEAQKAALPHLAGAFTERKEDVRWKLAYNWYLENAPELLGPVREGLLFRPGREAIDRKTAKELYPDSVSPSRLEGYSRCPFSHFIRYGLSPEERRPFSSDMRSGGDVYHLALQELSRRLSFRTLQEGLEQPENSGEKTKTAGNQNAPCRQGETAGNTQSCSFAESLWMTLEEEKLKELAGQIFEEKASGYREGMLNTSEAEHYRKERGKAVFLGTVLSLVRQVRAGDIREMFLEEPFRRTGTEIPAVSIETENGTCYIEGRIDRVDILPDHYVKIIDYKSGSDTFEREAAETGWRLQLMLYLTAALGKKTPDGSIPENPVGTADKKSRQEGPGMTETNRIPEEDTREKSLMPEAETGPDERKPAGVFYFHIADKDIDIGKMPGELETEIRDKVESELRKTYAMNGLVLEDGNVIGNIVGEEEPSVVIEKLKKKKDGSYTGPLIPEGEFRNLIRSVSETVRMLLDEMFRGNVSASPKEYKSETPCTYCSYKSICGIALRR